MITPPIEKAYKQIREILPEEYGRRLDAVWEDYISQSPTDDKEENLKRDAIVLGHINLIFQEALEEKEIEYKQFVEKQNQINRFLSGEKIYPNEPCPCGSGKKYKKCCGRLENRADSPLMKEYLSQVEKASHPEE